MAYIILGVPSGLSGDTRVTGAQETVVCLSVCPVAMF